MDKEFIGNIYMITSVDTKLLKYLQNYDIIDDDNLIACKYVLAKEDTRLIKIHDNCYIDYDNIKKPNNFKIISSLIKNGDTSNLLMENNVYKPYVGQLFVKELRRIKKLKYTQN